LILLNFEAKGTSEVYGTVQWHNWFPFQKAKNKKMVSVCEARRGM
jgi:hypothetical protein